ncbi:hypothetical protein [Haloferax massiliensis]|uniref:hypothetical protein n=1 Tax=Haloferax massiliensis TaxID=1476858 RepID=UPI001D012856|nr:hypothetical protein [Haloferax massiliensis]
MRGDADVAGEHVAAGAHLAEVERDREGDDGPVGVGDRAEFGRPVVSVPIRCVALGGSLAWSK